MTKELYRAATARRIYHHVLNGGKATPEDISRMVRAIEELESENIAMSARLEDRNYDA